MPLDYIHFSPLSCITFISSESNYFKISFTTMLCDAWGSMAGKLCDRKGSERAGQQLAEHEPTAHTSHQQKTLETAQGRDCSPAVGPVEATCQALYSVLGLSL